MRMVFIASLFSPLLWSISKFFRDLRIVLCFVPPNQPLGHVPGVTFGVVERKDMRLLPLSLVPSFPRSFYLLLFFGPLFSSSLKLNCLGQPLIL